MIRVSLFACLLALGAANPSLAEEIDCETAMAQQELNACAEQDWQAADSALNDAYKRAMAEMKDMDANMPEDLQGAADALRDAQRAWIPYRDANCTLAGFPMRGGSAEPLLVYGCLARMTEDRTAELLDMLSY